LIIAPGLLRGKNENASTWIGLKLLSLNVLSLGRGIIGGIDWNKVM
jgi:hypothetical protein